VPGRYRCGFLTPPVAGANLRAALVASCLRGAYPPISHVAPFCGLGPRSAQRAGPRGAGGGLERGFPRLSGRVVLHSGVLRAGHVSGLRELKMAHKNAESVNNSNSDDHAVADPRLAREDADKLRAAKLCQARPLRYPAATTIATAPAAITPPAPH